MFVSELKKMRKIAFRKIHRNICKMNGKVGALSDKMSCSCREIEIPVPWGKIAAKHWNYESKVHRRPILLAHGWKDNCGSFDRLVPLLPKSHSYVAFDFPGHGYSSRIPEGMYYHFIDVIIVYKLMAEHFKWEKVSIIGHSMGAISAFMFSSLFPDKVDFYVALDALKPMSKYPGSYIKETAINIDKFVRILNRDPVDSGSSTNSSKYTYEELCEKYHEASLKSIDTDKCHYLVERAKKSFKNQPDLFHFDLDARVKLGPLVGMMHDDLLEYARQITCPVLAIKALQNGFYEDKKNYFDVLNILKSSNENSRYVEVDGTHHVHLNQPERVAKHISDFIFEFYQN